MSRKKKPALKKDRAISPKRKSNLVRPEWLTVEDAAEYLRVTPGTIYRWTKTGQLIAYKFNGAPIRIKHSDLDTLAKPVNRKPDAWSQLSSAAFNQDWDNPDDAIYDNWRTLYGVQQG
jgi:excisionase family DNA binding protein